MALINCPQCGKVFNKSLRTICPDCIKKEEDQYNVVRDYLRQNRDSSPSEVSEATEVPLSLIYKFIREGRLLSSTYKGLFVECEKCGKNISTGRFCETCKDIASGNLNQLKDKLVESERNKQRGAYFTNH